jgi:hypothetical protein
MRGGKTKNENPISNDSFMTRFKKFFGRSKSKQSNTSEIRIIDPKELTNPDGSPFRFDDPKPLERYDVLVEYHLRGEPIAKRDGTFDIYAYKIVGDRIFLDGTLNIPEYGKSNRLNFMFVMHDGEIYIHPQNLLTTPDGEQMISRIVVKSPEDSNDLITPPPVPDLFKKILDDKEHHDAAAAAEKAADDDDDDDDDADWGL